MAAQSARRGWYRAREAHEASGLPSERAGGPQTQQAGL